MIINDLDGYYIVFDTKNWNTELDTLVGKSSIVWSKLGFSPINNLKEHVESSFLANASMKRE